MAARESSHQFLRREIYAEGVEGDGTVNIRRANGGNILLSLSAAAAEDLALDLKFQASVSRRSKEALEKAKARHPSNR